MITKRIGARKDGKSSTLNALRYGEGLKHDRESGELLSKSLRTRLGNFGLVDDGIYIDQGAAVMMDVITLAALEMQVNCDFNTRVGHDKKIAHFIVSFSQAKPSDAVLRDTEDSMLAALGMDNNHFATFLHNDNGYWHLHIFASRIDKIKHLGNPLWQDRTIRDRLCKEIELRHGLERDNGLHKIDEAGQIVEVPREERRKRQGLKSIITDKARTTEAHSGEKTFQSWVEEIRMGDRLKHAKSWQNLHAAAAAYGCEIKQKGAGFIICPLGEKGGIQLSRVGLKNLPSKFGAFQLPTRDRQRINQVAAYKPAPLLEKGAGHYSAWRNAKREFQPIKTELLQDLRQRHKTCRHELKEFHRSELKEIRARTTGNERFTVVSVAKMHQAIQLTALSDQFKHERKALYKVLADQGPGNTFRAYLVREAQNGDNVALGLTRNYGINDATKVSQEREEVHFRIKAAITGNEYVPASRLQFTHHVEPSGAVVYQLGRDRLIVDSSVARRIQLNDVAAHDPEAISTALRFATLKFGSNLSLTGPPEFQRKAVEISARERMSIRFTDPALEAYRLKLIEHQNLLEYPSYQRNKESHYASHHRIEHLRQIPPAHIQDRLRNLSLGDLVLDTSGDVRSLRTNVPHRMEQQEQGHDSAMQRTAGRAQRVGDDVGKPKFAGHGAGANQGTGNEREQIPLTQSQAQTEAHASVSAWADEWAKTNGKRVVEPRAGSGRVQFTVIHVGEDKVVLDLGRTIAIYPKPRGQSLKAGDKVIVGKQLQILLQQKSIGPIQER